MGADSLALGGGSAQVRNVVVYGDNDTSTEGGNDTIQLNAGSGTLISKAIIAGGAGADTLSFVGGEVIGLDANGNAGADTFTVNASASMISSTVYGGKGNDIFTLTSASGGVIYGDAGADSFSGLTTKTALYGDSDGNDTFTNAGVSTSATVYGGNGNDVFTNTSGGYLSSTVYGGGGADSFIGGVSSSNVMGESGNDTIGLTAITSSTVLGGVGADTIGTTANVFTSSSIVGGSGNDSFAGATFSGGNTASTFFFGFGSGADTLNLGSTLLCRYLRCGDRCFGHLRWYR